MANLSDAQREELVALELLRQSIVQLNASVIANAQRETKAAAPSAAKSKSKGGGGGSFGVTGGGMAGVLASLTKALGPIAVLGGLMAGMQPAFQLLSAALNILGTTILPIVMPLFVVLAAGLLMLSDTIFKDLEPQLEAFYELIFSGAIPALESLIEAFSAAASAVKKTGEEMGEWIGKKLYGEENRPGEDMSKFEDASERAAEKARADALAAGRTADEAEAASKYAKHGGTAPDWMSPGGTPAAAGPVGAAAAPAAAPAAGSTAAKPKSAMSAMKDVFAELRSQQGAKAKFTSIEDVSKNASLAGLNRSPFEAQIFERMDKMIGAMERAANNTERTTPPVYETSKKGS